MASRLFQSLIYQMKDVTDRIIGVLDDTKTIVACSDAAKIGKEMLNLVDLFDDNLEVASSEGYTYKAIGVRNKIDFIVFISGEDDIARQTCAMLAISISNVKQYYDEKYDKSHFIKNVIMDNILPGDIPVKAKELHLQLDAHRVALLIRAYDTNDFFVHDIVESLFPTKNKDFIVSLDEKNIVLVKELKDNYDPSDVEKIAKTIVDTINAEALIKTSIGVGTVVDNIKYIAKSYKEAQVALEVGKVFDTEKNIINYDNLGIGRLIYQLPTTLCELFLQEVFKKGSIESLDEEIITTIQKFFENNLNVSETSRQLFVHRNTLVYRLDKIQKLTGLDLRTFDDAIVFKVAMMVKKYLNCNLIKI